MPLTANIGLSRKLTRDYNSTGFSVHLEGDILVDRNDAEAVVERIQELYDLGEEALQRQIERYESDSAIASHDAEPPASPPPTPPESSPAQATSPPPSTNGSKSTNGTARNRISGEPATNKQIQFLLTMAKRMKLSKPKLEKRIEQILGEKVDVYDLSKRDCGVILDTLTDKDKAKSESH